MWEDEANKNGGRWQISIGKGYANIIWENLILALIGEQFEYENEITGIAIKIVPNHDIISIWNRTGKDPVIRESIKQDLIHLINFPSDIKMEYNEFAAPEEKTNESRPPYKGK